VDFCLEISPMKRQLSVWVLPAALGLLMAPGVFGQETVEPQTSPNPLAPFERWIGGQWHLDGSYQEIEWGLGKRSVKSRSYFIVDGKPQLVSEGSWFWHPGEGQIKGVFTAVEMPVVFFDYTTRFEDGRMVNDLRSYDAAGNESLYVETWEFVDETHYEWTLLLETGSGLEKVMGGTYERKSPPPLPSR
jgi:hypothetical protein